MSQRQARTCAREGHGHGRVQRLPHTRGCPQPPTADTASAPTEWKSRQPRLLPPLQIIHMEAHMRRPAHPHSPQPQAPSQALPTGLRALSLSTHIPGSGLSDQGTLWCLLLPGWCTLVLPASPHTPLTLLSLVFWQSWVP